MSRSHLHFMAHTLTQRTEKRGCGRILLSAVFTIRSIVNNTCGCDHTFLRMLSRSKQLTLIVALSAVFCPHMNGRKLSHIYIICIEMHDKRYKEWSWNVRHIFLCWKMYICICAYLAFGPKMNTQRTKPPSKVIKSRRCWLWGWSDWPKNWLRK